MSELYKVLVNKCKYKNCGKLGTFIGLVYLEDIKLTKNIYLSRREKHSNPEELEYARKRYNMLPTLIQ